MTLLQKLTSGIVIGGIAIAAVLYVALVGLFGLDREFDRLTETTMPVTQVLIDLRFLALRSLVRTQETVLQVEEQRDSGAGDGAELISRLRDETRQQAAEWRQRAADYRRLIASYFPGEAAMAQRIDALVTALEGRIEDIGAHLAAGNLAPALIDDLSLLRRSSDDFLAAINAAIAAERAELAAHHEDMHGGFTSYLFVAFCLAGLALLLHIGVNAYIARSLLRRLHRLHIGIDRIAAGSYFAGAVDTSRDELGSLSRAFGRMTDKLQLAEFAREKAERALRIERDQLQQRVEAATLDLKEKAAALEQALGREKQLNEMQRQFITTASHEFRTPLAIISSTAQRLGRGKAPLTSDELNGRIGRITSAVKRMTDLIDSTLSAEQLDAGAIANHIDDCDLAAIIAEVAAQQQDLSPDHVIACDLRRLPSSLRGDRLMLTQVFANLVSNAVKYSPGGGEVRLDGWQDGDAAVVTVSDRGLGIDEDDLPRIFQRFFRARTAVGIAGTGIGLNLVQGLVAMHGGTIAVESRKGEGSTFTVRLPLAGPTISDEPQREAA
jgi:signal transduction histidine kinase